MYITICKIDEQRKFDYDAGHSKLMLPEGWDGEGGRRVVQDGWTHVHQWLIYVYV